MRTPSDSNLILEYKGIKIFVQGSTRCTYLAGSSNGKASLVLPVEPSALIQILP